MGELLADLLLLAIVVVFTIIVTVGGMGIIPCY